MKSKQLLMSVAASVVVLTAVVGCGTNPTNAQIGTGVGAVAGGVVGNACSAAPWVPLVAQPLVR